MNKKETIIFYIELIRASSGTHLNVHEMLTDIIDRINESDSQKIERLKCFAEAYKTVMDEDSDID